MDYVKTLAEFCGSLLEVLGVTIITFPALYAIGHGLLLLIRRTHANDIFETVRQQLGRGILLGLELLVAADIINTVAVEPSFKGVGVLAIIVAIRTFLSFTLEVEMTGRWPWQKKPA